MKKSMKGKMLTILLSMTMVFTMLSMNTGMVFADEPDYDIGNCQVTFDQSYLVEDDDPGTPYVEQFYDVPEGTALEPVVADGGNVLSQNCYKAYYSEVYYYEDIKEYNIVDDSNWQEAFPSKPGVYFCKVQGISPYYGSYEWIPLIRVTGPRTVTFDSNGGTGDMDPIRVPAGEKLTVPEAGFKAPQGKAFRGWNTRSKAEGSAYGTWYNPGDEVSLRSNLTLYARWGDPGLSLCSYDNTNSKSMQGGKFKFNDEKGHYGDRWSYGCNNYTLVMGDRYWVAAAPDNGYRYLGLYKGKYISTAEHSQDAYPYMDQKITADRKYDFTVTDSMVICPVFEKAPLVNFVDIGNVWTELDPVNEVPFTGEVNPDEEGLSDFIEIAEETWTSTDGKSVISSGDPAVPVVGKTYKYSVKIAARGENTFDPAAGFRFVFGGTEFNYDDLEVKFSQDNKTATISGFVPDKTVAAVDLKTAAVSRISAKTYTGKKLTQNPVVTMTVNGTKVILKKGTDYDVSYKNNINVGPKAAVYIKGKGKYKGTKTATFRIDPKGTSIKSLAGAKKAATVNWNKQTARMKSSRITGYQIQFATDSKFKKNKKTVNVKGYKIATKKVGGLKANKKYYVRLRTYKTVSKVDCYSTWSKTKTVKTK